MVSVNKEINWLKLALGSSEVKSEANQFYNPAQVEQMQQVARTYFKAVCQIQTTNSNKRGTGCLIEGGLVITHHVIDNEETAKKSHAVFFRFESQAFDKAEVITKTNVISLDPDRYFFTKSSNVDENLQKVDFDHIDFTIVALKLDAFQIPDKIFSIFQENVFPQEKTPINIINHPDVVETHMKGDFRWTIGLIQKIEGCSIHYNAAAVHGSSGGVVIDLQGKLIALHYQSFECDCDASKSCNSGLLVSQVGNYLRSEDNYKKKNQEPIIEKLIADEKERNKKLKENLLFNHLKNFYCSQAEIKTLIKERKLSIEEVDVRLAMITEEKDKEKKDGKIQKPPEDGRWLNEAIYDHKEFIKLEELFHHKKLKESKAKRAIFFGAAGIGKTTCFHKIAHEWANGRLWTEFKAVFWICLRNLNADSYPSRYEGYDAYDLIAKECKLLSREFNLDLSTFRSILKDEAFRMYTLLVLDGYDELPFTADNGHLSDAFQQLEKIFPHILISSRLQDVLFIENPVKMEILGFSQKGIDQYIGKFYDQISKTSGLSSEKLQKRLGDLHDLLKQKQLIRNLFCIPINLELLCCLCFFEEVDANALTNITSLYSHIINWLYKRFLLKPGMNQVTTDNIHRRENLRNHPQIKPLTSKLEEIAWHGMKEQIRGFNLSKLENKFDLDVDIGSLGLLHIKNKIANFIHLTFQEYFAAAYLANYYMEWKSETIKEDFSKNKLNSRYALVFEMAAGYLSRLDEIEVLQKFFDDLISEPYDLAVNYELNLLARCFEECKDPSIIKQYAKFIEFAAGYIQNNWFINNHYIAQLLKNNPSLLGQGKIYQVIVEALSKCEKIILGKQDNNELVDFATDVIVKTYSFKNIKEGIEYVRGKFTSFLLEMAEVSHEINGHVLNIFTNARKSPNSSVKRDATRALEEICRSDKASEETLMAIVKALTEALSDADKYVRSDAANVLGEICRSERASEETLIAIVNVLPRL